MRIYVPNDFEALYDECLKEYLTPEYYSAAKATTEYIPTQITASTIDEYLMLLRKGYVNVEIRSTLDKHLMELFQDSWFFQWSLIHEDYACRLLHGDGYDSDTERAIEILDSLAKEGCPRAMFEIGLHYRYGFRREENYPRAICLWLVASKKGYRGIWNCFDIEFQNKKYKELPLPLQMFFLDEYITLFLEKHNATRQNYKAQLDQDSLSIVNRIKKQGAALQKQILGRATVMAALGTLLGENEDHK